MNIASLVLMLVLFTYSPGNFWTDNWDTNQRRQAHSSFGWWKDQYTLMLKLVYAYLFFGWLLIMLKFCSMNILGWKTMIGRGTNKPPPGMMKKLTMIHFSFGSYQLQNRKRFQEQISRTNFIMVSIFEDVQCENVKWPRGRSPTQDQPSLAVTYSLTAGLLLSLILIITGNEYPSFFSSDSRVQALVKEITPFLAISIFIKYIYILYSACFI